MVDVVYLHVSYEKEFIMPGKKKVVAKKYAASASDAKQAAPDVRVAIRINTDEGAERIQAVEFNDKGLKDSKEFSAKVPFTSEVYAKFVAYIGERRAYGESPYAVHLVSQGLKLNDLPAMPKLIYAYDHYKSLHPEESKNHRGQHPLSVIAETYPAGKFQGAKQLAHVILKMRVALQEKGLDPDKFENGELARRQDESDKRKAREAAKAAKTLPIKPVLAKESKLDEKEMNVAAAPAAKHRRIAWPDQAVAADEKYSVPISRISLDAPKPRARLAASASRVDDKAAAQALIGLSKFSRSGRKPAAAPLVVQAETPEVPWNERQGLYAMKF